MKMELKRELFWYVVFGVLTTVVNILSYLLFARIFNVNYIYSNIIAWFLSVLFAYITNRIWVFESKSSNIIKEAFYFFAGRIFSGVLDTGLMYVFIDLLSFGDEFSKIIIQVIVVIVNYVLSKYVVFNECR